MVSFQCKSCGDIFPRRKIDSHLDRCWNTSFSCLDCQSLFWGQDYKNHTTQNCLGNTAAFHDSFYKHKKQKPSVEFYDPPIMLDQPRTPYQAYVKDAEEEPSPLHATLAEVHVPPRAPSPPSAATPPVNVFDFLVAGSASASSASSVSSFASEGEDSDVSMSPELGRTPVLSRSPSRADFGESNGHVYSETFYSYGSGPIETSNERFDSEYDLNMQLQRIEQPTESSDPQPLDNATVFQTPAPAHGDSLNLGNSTDSRSDKKRKRPQVEDLDLTSNNKNGNRALLHSGLTGGLMKLVNDSAEQSAQASPLSPKKRSKPSRELQVSRPRKQKDENRSQQPKERKHKHKRRHSTRDGADDGNRMERRSRRRQEQLLLEGRKDLKAIEYYPTTSSNIEHNGIVQHQNDREYNSTFFLRLIDKDHHSVKGQSLWGLLKMFHEGRYHAQADDDEQAEEIQKKEERLLLKGLRAKISKNGDIILFARPEAEIDE